MALKSKLGGSKGGDPSLYVEIVGKKRSLLFDCGINTLTNSEILKISDIFISHTHVDHFIGFDGILRISLSADKRLGIYGPKGIRKNIRSKLGGYNWNIAQNIPLSLRVYEIQRDSIIISSYIGKNGFRFNSLKKEEKVGRCLLKAEGFSVEYMELDHKTLCLAYSIIEEPAINIDKEKLQELNFIPGPWIKELKRAVKEGLDGFIQVNDKEYSIGYLKDKLVKVRKGDKITYVTDTIINEESFERIVQFASYADKFYCEATFLEKDRNKAKATYHMTAREAGILAREAQVKELIIFHFSRRYEDNYQRLIDEARKEFENVT